MIPVKVECGCGQKYAFDVDPVHGHMPAPVKCPACGTDGTQLANEFIAQALAMQPAVVAVTAAQATPAAHAIRLAPSAAAAAPPPRADAGGAASLPSLPQSPLRPLPKPSRAKDGWDKEETQLNKLGTYLIVGPVILAALFASGTFGVELSAGLLGIIVAVGGVLGGILNIAGRGPILAGAVIGFVIAVGGYGTVYWWIQGRESVRKFEILIAFLIGMAPGFLLQMGLQALLRKRAGE